MVVRENKYTVLKNDDIFNLLSEDEQKTLGKMIETINMLRKQQGKKQNDYLVVNVDEPYAYHMWDIVLEFEKLKLRNEGKCTECQKDFTYITEGQPVWNDKNDLVCYNCYAATQFDENETIEDDEKPFPCGAPDFEPTPMDATEEEINEMMNDDEGIVVGETFMHKYQEVLHTCGYKEHVRQVFHKVCLSGKTIIRIRRKDLGKTQQWIFRVEPKEPNNLPDIIIEKTITTEHSNTITVEQIGNMEFLFAELWNKLEE